MFLKQIIWLNAEIREKSEVICSFETRKLAVSFILKEFKR